MKLKMLKLLLLKDIRSMKLKMFKAFTVTGENCEGVNFPFLLQLKLDLIIGWGALGFCIKTLPKFVKLCRIFRANASFFV